MRAEPSRPKEHSLDDLLRARGLLRVPFSPDEKNPGMFPSDSHREALTQLDTTAALRGVMVLTGPPGTGKSTLLKTWMRGLEPKRYLPLLITQSSLSATGVLEILLAKLGERPRFKRSTNLLALEKHLADIEPMTVVLVLDDAQNSPSSALEELRMLLGLGGRARSAFALILLGDDYLLGSLRLSIQRALLLRFAPVASRLHIRVALFLRLSRTAGLVFSRISAAQGLHPLPREDIAPYLNWHIARAGLEHEIFAPAAIDLLAEASEGNPRALNLLAQAAWLASARSGASDIEPAHVHCALRQVPIGNAKTANP